MLIDRTHIQDLHAVGLIDAEIREALPDDLRKRLEAIDASVNDEV